MATRDKRAEKFDPDLQIDGASVVSYGPRAGRSTAGGGVIEPTVAITLAVPVDEFARYMARLAKAVARKTKVRIAFEFTTEQLELVQGRRDDDEPEKLSIREAAARGGGSNGETAAAD